jgi:hypothetical protein
MFQGMFDGTFQQGNQPDQSMFGVYDRGEARPVGIDLPPNYAGYSDTPRSGGIFLKLNFNDFLRHNPI